MGKTIAIFGAGQSGQAARRLAQSLGQAAVLFDEGGQGDASVFSAEAIGRFDSFVFSPGFAADHPWRRIAAESGRPCLSELAYAAPHWRGQLVGVTGTNGKTTVTRLLADALGEVKVKDGATLRVLAVGNIGYPLADAVLSTANQAGAYAVVEISSFQAELSQTLQLDGLLWTNFAEDHLDRYAGMDAYFAAKAQLLGCLKRDAHCILGPSLMPWMERQGPTCQASRSVDQATGWRGRLHPDSVFRRFPNTENFDLAAAWWQACGLPAEALLHAANGFTPAPHRLALVFECDGVRYWDDSKATNFHAALAAVESVAAPIVWIGGGRAKGGDLGAFARAIAAKVAVAVLYGEAAQPLATALHGQSVRLVQEDRFADAVRAAVDIAAVTPGANVLLSPGFASFDQFESYRARGKSFRDLVLGLKRAREVG